MIKNVFNSHLRFQHKIVFIFWRKWMNIILGFNLVIWYTILQILHIFFFSQQYLFEYQKSMKNSLSLWWYELYGKLYDTYTNANKNNSIINTDSGADYFWKRGGGQNCAQSAKNYLLPPLIIRPYSS